MKKHIPLLLLLALCLFNIQAKAQFTETFEDETSGSSSFSGNGLTFNIAEATFDIYYDNTSAYGWNGTAADYKLIDNSNHIVKNGGDGTGNGATMSFSSAGGTHFNVKSFYLYTGDQYAILVSTGSVTVTGKLGGSQVFSVTKNSGFTTTTSTNNGYTFFDLSTLGGTDNSNKAIDELIISSTGNMDYLGFDAFTWDFPTPLPVTLTNYQAVLQPNGEVKLNWETAAELNNAYYQVDKSSDGKTFEKLATINAKGNGTSSQKQTYSCIDQLPYAGANYYRLSQYDKDGKTTILGTKAVNVALTNANSWSVYPNPVETSFTIAIPKTYKGNKNVSIYDASGKLVYHKSLSINDGKIDVNLSQQPISGVYQVNVQGLGAKGLIVK